MADDNVMGSSAMTEGNVDSNESGKSGRWKTHSDKLTALVSVLAVGVAMMFVAVVGWLTAA